MVKTLSNLKADATQSEASPKVAFGIDMGNFTVVFTGKDIMASNGENAILIPLEEFKKLLTDNEPSFLQPRPKVI